MFFTIPESDIALLASYLGFHVVLVLIELFTRGLIFISKWAFNRFVYGKKST